MKKILCIILTILILVACSGTNSLSEEEIIKNRVEDFFKEVYEGDVNGASKYLSKDAKAFVEKFDFNEILNNYLGGFNLFSLPDSISKTILSKFAKEGIKSHEVLEIRKINDELYEVDVRLNMLDIENIANNINLNEITGVLTDNYQEILKLIFGGSDDSFENIMSSIINSFTNLDSFKNFSFYNNRIITMELEKDVKWYIKTLVKKYN